MPKFTKKLPPTDPALSSRAKAVAASFDPKQIEEALRQQPAANGSSVSDVREILERIPQRSETHTDRAWTISRSPRSIANVLWPFGYILVFAGGSVSLGAAVLIASSTYKLMQPLADHAVAFLQRI